MAKISLRKKKIETVEKLIEKLKKTKVLIVTEYRGLTVSEVTDIRKKLRESKSDYKVIKNTLVKKALKSLSAVDENIEKLFVGPVAIAFHTEDPVNISKILSDFAKEHENLKIKGGLLESKILTLKEINTLANLPSREILIAKVVGGMKSPINKLVFTLKGVINKLVFTLEAVKEQKNKK